NFCKYLSEGTRPIRETRVTGKSLPALRGGFYNCGKGFGKTKAFQDKNHGFFKKRTEFNGKSKKGQNSKTGPWPQISWHQILAIRQNFEQKKLKTSYGKAKLQQYFELQRTY
ncbi:MAG: hypothetical protein WC285_04325, partial [Candidatus Gracilibacteria bacterium]